MKKFFKEYSIIIIIFLIAVILILTTILFSIACIESNKWWNSLTPEEQKEFALRNERNYEYDYVDGIVNRTTDTYYYGGVRYYRTEAEIYCLEMDDTIIYNDRTTGIDKPKLWGHRNSEHVKCERVTITNGYNEIIEQRLTGDIELYENE